MAYSTELGNFAILEYKSYGTISPQEFENAKLTRQVHGPWVADRHVCRFDDKSGILMKQAVHYAYSFGTKYVALFDFRTLVLLYMKDLQDNDGGFQCLATVIKSKSKMRRALLGFLAKAYLTQKDKRVAPPQPLSDFSIGAAGPGNSGETQRTTRSATRA